MINTEELRIIAARYGITNEETLKALADLFTDIYEEDIESIYDYNLPFSLTQSVYNKGYADALEDMR